MNALPLCAAIALMLASAGSAANSSGVTLYGRVDLNLTRFDDSSWQMRQASNSRIGLRGTESLGSGFNAIFQLEARINADTGTAETPRFWGRESWVGLQGPWGSLRLGRSPSPAQRMASLHDPHGTDGIGSFGTSGLLLGHSAPQFGRFDDGVYYDSPLWRGITASAAWALQGPAGKNDQRYQSLRLRYRHGPVDVSLGRGDLSRGNYIDSFGVNWKLLCGQLMLQRHQGQRDARRRASWLVGATAPVPGGELRMSYSKQEDRGTGLQTNRSLLALGYHHRLGPGTTGYATVARERSDRTERSVHTRARTGIEAGLRHSF